MEQARQLFRDFCFYRQYTAHVQQIKKERPYLRDLKDTPDRLRLFDQMARWCEAREINPREWVYSLFVTRRWLFCPRIEPAHLLSEKHLPRFREISDFGLYRQRQLEQQSIAAPDVHTFDPNRDLSHTAEETKAAHLRGGQPAACMEAMFIDTFGYHPRSAVCSQCHVVEQCRALLIWSVSFDVLALRLGKITSEQARIQALNKVQHAR
ncbi:MAG: hypothetical protein A2Y61_00315 [Chloroflexi bacterium RBG_13_60_13]|nr:MAG: hypothetical protein A2Y61_00315 [Chloroflexi bacterium RBG_13_60_13]